MTSFKIIFTLSLCSFTLVSFSQKPNFSKAALREAEENQRQYGRIDVAKIEAFKTSNKTYTDYRNDFRRCQQKIIDQHQNQTESEQDQQVAKSCRTESLLMSAKWEPSVEEEEEEEGGEELLERQGGNYADWMSNLSNEAKKRPLNRIIMPGSHDSATWDLDPESALAPDPNANKILDGIKKYACCGILCIPICDYIDKAIARFSMMQDKKWQEQLDLGIRYLDLRVAKRESGELAWCHAVTFTKQNVEDGLKDITKWTHAHPTEYVILHFQHTYAMDESEHNTLFKFLYETFGEKLIQRPDAVFKREKAAKQETGYDSNIDDFKDLTLEYLDKTKQGQRVLVFYSLGGGDAATNAAAKKAFFAFPHRQSFWPSDWIANPYKDSDDVDALTEFIEKTYEQGAFNPVQVLQGIRTIHVSDIASNFFRSSLKHFCGPMTKRLAEDFIYKYPYAACKKAGNLKKGPMNIMMANFVEMFDFTGAILKLNPGKMRWEEFEKMKRS